MASVIRGDDNFDSEGIVDGSAKAWAQCDETGSIGASYNISSVSESGTVYTVNFDSALEDTSYAVQLTGGDNGSSVAITGLRDADDRTTSDFTFQIVNASGNPITSREYIAITVFR